MDPADGRAIHGANAGVCGGGRAVIDLMVTDLGV